MVSSPLDDTTVNSPQLRVAGRSSPDATVSVSGRLVVLKESGDFETVLPLVKGPNLIEVIASDLAGGLETRVMTVIYIP